MSGYEILTDKSLIEAHLRLAPDLHLYQLGDLDDFFWPQTRWYARMDGGEIGALALLYGGEDPPVLLAIANDNRAAMTALLKDLTPDLPAEVYAHLSLGLEDVFMPAFSAEDRGIHYKMSLAQPEALTKWDTSTVIPLSLADLPSLEALYAAAYPGTWFNPRMLETGQYAGIEDSEGRLLSAAGVHVYSEAYRVAALGNITTLLEARGQGLATKVTAGCCQRLLETVDLIGLNVRCDNLAAVRAYQKIGFVVTGEYQEWLFGRE